ncbi:hypothetical protein PAMP_001304 [Pampus punctatissimus]
MMESLLNSKADRLEQVEVDNLKRDLSSDFRTISDPQQSSTEEREHLQVYLRIRPFTSAESHNGESQDCVTIESPDTVLLKPPSSSLSARLSTDKSLPQTGQRFQFSQVYGPDTTQGQLFEGTVKDLVKDVLEGENSLVFTYGVTNAGKTFTFLGPDADAGILPRSLDIIFNSIDERIFTGISIKPHRCQEYTRLSREQQAEEAAFKRNLFRQLKESEKSNASLLNSTNKTVVILNVSFAGSNILGTTVAAEDRISLEVEKDTKFSVWVSFCEIYNENIHDLLEVVPSGALRRNALRLSQDVKGNAFVKDLRWVEVNSAEEAFNVMKLGKKNQHFSSTRLNQLSSRRLLRHVPFRESKLTHYLQGFFCGRGKACMIVNINQCASMYDETLSVLKFSAVAQKVVVLSTRPIPIIPQKSANEVLPPINNAERKTLRGSRRSSLIGWETSLEDVQEDENDEYEEENIPMDDTMDQSCNEEDGDENDDKILISKRTHQKQMLLLKQLQIQLKKERAESLLMEARVREEISREFSELFSEMQNDYNDRLAREREILEEQGERRLEIFKNLIDKMATDGPMDSSLDSYSSAHECQGSGRAGAQGDGCEAVEENQRKVQEQLAHKTTGEASEVEDEEKRRPPFELQEKTSDVAQLEKQVANLGSSHERKRLQELLAALEKEKKAREAALTALEYQTMGKEEALASLEEERKAREETLATLRDLKRSKEQVMVSLEEMRKVKNESMAALEAERRAKEDAIAALAEEKQTREGLLAALSEEKIGKEEAQSVLAAERKEITKLVEERETKQKEGNALRQELGELTAKLKTTERQVTSETERAEQASVQLQAAQAQLDERGNEIQEKTSQIHTLIQEVQGLKEELQTRAVLSGGIDDELRKEVSDLKKNLAMEKDKSESKQKQMMELQDELAQAKEQLAHKQLISDQQLNQLTEKLNHQEAASNKQLEELRKKLLDQEEMSQQPLDELRAKLECEEHASKEEVKQLRAKLEEQTQTSEKHVGELNEKLREQEVISKKQVEELKHKLSEEKATSDQLLNDLKQQLSEQKQAAELLKTKLEEATCKNSNSASCSATEEDFKMLNSDLQTELASLRRKVANIEEKKLCLSDTETQLASSEMEKMLKEKEDELAESNKASAEREAELQKKLLEKELQITSLQKNLQQAQERREEDESQAVQEARRREVERRRELLAVAHEAIAQKDAELEKKGEEINRLKENAKQDSEKVKSLSLNLQRKEDDTSDLREKLADYKKQIQQVQREISTMREEEKVLRQKLSDVEKAKKLLQSDVANRDRTIQQLKVEQSSGTKSDQTLQLYQKACKDLEVKESIMEDMRLALTEQEETQEQMEQVLEEKLNLIQELSSEVEKLRGMFLQQDHGNSTHYQTENPSDDIKQAKQEAVQAQESLKLCTEKHQAERKKWLEEKLSLIGQAKEAEDKRNHEMRKFAEDRERYTRQHSQLESLSSQLADKEQTMERWRKERDTLVAALEVQLQKLLSSQAEKDKLIQQLRQNNTQPPQEGVNGGGVSVAELQAAVSEREMEILRLKEELKAATTKQMEANIQVSSEQVTAHGGDKSLGESETINRKSGGRRDTRASVSSQGSAGYPSVLDSSEISTENGRTRRFPQPELEISFSPLQPNRMALRRQGDESAVTVKITRSARKRKSGEMEKISTPANRHDSQSSIRSRKEGTLQKIGDFLQSSPTLLGTKAKKMMSLVSGRGDADLAAVSSSSSSSLSLKAKKKKRKLYRPEISSPIDMPSHPIITREPEEKESDHQIIKRRLRSRMVK